MNKEKRIKELVEKTCSYEEEQELFQLWNIERIKIRGVK